jgi:DNA invertase Pin-like site-specific DNA recombinase
VAIYLRVSSDSQTTDNQRIVLTDWAARCGHTVVETYEDFAISGAKTSAQRPAMTKMLKDATRRRFDIVAAWVDRSTGSQPAGPSGNPVTPGEQQDRSASASTGDRHHHTRRESALQHVRGVRGIRAWHPAGAHQRRHRTRPPQGHQERLGDPQAIEAVRTALAQPGASIRTVAAATGISVGKGWRRWRNWSARRDQAGTGGGRHGIARSRHLLVAVAQRGFRPIVSDHPGRGGGMLTCFWNRSGTH